MKLIYAKSDIVPENKNSFQKHEPDARETYNVRLFEKPQKEVPLPTDVKTMDFLFNNVKIKHCAGCIHENVSIIWYCRSEFQMMITLCIGAKYLDSRIFTSIT